MSRCIQGNLNYPCPSPREILSRSSVLCVSLCLTADGPRALPFTHTPHTSSFKPAPQAVFLPHLSSGQLPSFQLLGPKPQSSWILFFLSYPTSNQLVGSPGSFTFKTESDSKPLHSSPATTHLQTTSRVNYSFSLFYFLLSSFQMKSLHLIDSGKGPFKTLFNYLPIYWLLKLCAKIMASLS